MVHIAGFKDKNKKKSKTKLQLCLFSTFDELTLKLAWKGANIVHVKFQCTQFFLSSFFGQLERKSCFQYWTTLQGEPDSWTLDSALGLGHRKGKKIATRASVRTKNGMFLFIGQACKVGSESYENMELWGQSWIGSYVKISILFWILHHTSKRLKGKKSDPSLVPAWTEPSWRLFQNTALPLGSSQEITTSEVSMGSEKKHMTFKWKEIVLQLVHDECVTGQVWSIWLIDPALISKVEHETCWVLLF